MIAVVTGASRGIGLAVARMLAADGARVVAGARHGSPELEAVAEVVEVDLADPAGPARLVDKAGERVDVLVNNVGLATPRTGGFLGITDDQWAASLNLNLMAAVRATRAALPRMPDGGAIVNICSVNAALPEPLVVDYSAAKAALAAFSKALSKELGPRGIRVNTVSPGPVATDLWLGEHGVAETVSAATGATPGAVQKGAAAAMVTGRFSRPEEVAAAVRLLVDPGAANVTGTDVRVDGGYNPAW